MKRPHKHFFALYTHFFSFEAFFVTSKTHVGVFFWWWNIKKNNFDSFFRIKNVFYARL